MPPACCAQAAAGLRSGAWPRTHCPLFSPARSAKFKVPLRVCALAAFPMTPGANATEIQKEKLREMARELMRGS